MVLMNIYMISLGLDKQQEYVASQVGVEAEAVKAECAVQALELEELTPDEVLHHGEEEFGLGLDQLFLEPESKAMDVDQEEEATPSLVPERDGTDWGKAVSDSCESQVCEGKETAQEVEPEEPSVVLERDSIKAGDSCSNL